MKKRDFYITIIVYAVLSTALIVSKLVWEYNLDWLMIFIIVFGGYLYVRYRLTAPIQRFNTKFNMLVDYDLDMDAAIDLCLEHIKEAPLSRMKTIYEVHLGIAYYSNGEFERALAVFNDLDLGKLHSVYHVLVFVHQAYIYDHLGQKENFEAVLERLKNVKSSIQRRYIGYANASERLLSAIGNINEDPEEYKQVIEVNLGQPNGFVSQRLIYHYRLAKYYEVLGQENEMEIELAKVLANGKSHYTAKEAHKLFKNTVNVDDYVFTEEEFYASPLEPEAEVVDEPEQIETTSEIDDVFDQKEDIQ